MANTTSYAATKYSNLSKARLHITYVNSKPASLDCEWKNGGRSHGDGTGGKLVGQFPSSVAIYIFLTTKFVEIFLSIAVRQGIFARLFSFRKRGFPATLCMPGEPPFTWNTSRDWTKPSQFKVTSMSCMIHGIFSVCDNQHQGVTY